jgi:hypothetical protein
VAQVADPATITSLVDLLGELVEVPAPAPVSMLPQTAGWLVAGTVLLLVLALVAYRAWRRYRANAYRRDALAALTAAHDDPASIAVVLRRVAVSAYPRREVAGLAGEAWLRFLDAHCEGSRFATDGRALLEGPYRSMPPAPELTALARGWIRGHRRLP